MNSNIYSTFLVSLVILIMGIYLSVILADNFNKVEVGMFVYIRRISGYLFSMVYIGLNVSLVRNIAFNLRDSRKVDRYKLASIYILLLSFLFLFFVLLFSALFSQSFSSFVDFNTIKVTVIYVVGVMMLNYSYALYRSEEKINASNVIILVGMGVIPLVVLVLGGYQEVTSYISCLGLTLVIFSSVVLAHYYFSFFSNINNFCMDVTKEIRELLVYGWSRMLSPLLLFLIYSSLVFSLEISSNSKEVAMLVIALFLIRILEQAVSPIAVVMLPSLSNKIGLGNKIFIKKYIQLAFEITLIFGFFLSNSIYVLAPNIVSILYGSEYQDVVSPLRVLALVIPAMLGISLFQTIVDASTSKAIVLKYYLVITVLLLLSLYIARPETTSEVAYYYVFLMSLMFFLLCHYSNSNIASFINRIDLLKQFIVITLVGLSIYVTSYLFVNTTVFYSLIIQPFLFLLLFVLINVLFKTRLFNIFYYRKV